jgi:hypothetical protein
MRFEVLAAVSYDFQVLQYGMGCQLFNTDVSVELGL